ncbi:tumor necrosis factor receptor superfamily member 1A-like [Triplophysa dalaica]|uniref:tumor necrosis factor receptor superfamily member 1A-like n=1 Tax=Triplophysa dalaica TaxID=1582913 RepID=UPI0024E01055|nr:tumor necrosis factor receptor superfamily member 1A-like [Triplophysa dalaica]
MMNRQGNHMKKLQTCIFLLLVIEFAVGHSVKNKGDCAKNEFWCGDGFCCDKCEPGYKLVKKCSSGVKSICEKCTEGTYQDKMNYFPNCFRCQKCIKLSRPHAVEISACTAQNNTVCGCQHGYRKRFLNSFTWDCVLSKKMKH